MSKKRNSSYKSRKNFKRSWRRREHRHKAAMAPLCHPLAAAALQYALPLEDRVLFVFHDRRLQHVKKAVRRVDMVCRWSPGSDSSLNSQLLATRHDHEPLRPIKRIRDASRDNEVMIKSFDAFFWGPGREFSGTLAGFQYCPHHFEKPVLRVFPAPNSPEFYFRCHHCGTTLKSLEFFRSLLPRENEPWETTAQRALDIGLIAEPVSPEAVAGHELLSRWRNAMPAGRRNYEHYVRIGEIQARFGDWLAVMPWDLRRLLNGLKLPFRIQEKRNLVRVNRNPWGFPASLELYSIHAVPSAKIIFTDDTLTFNTPRWCDFIDWNNDIVVCPDSETATSLERAISRWPEDQRIPVAMISQTSQPLATPLPFRNVWLPVRADQSADYGLILYGDGASNLRVRRFPGVDPELRNLETITKRELCEEHAPSCLDVVVQEIARDLGDLGCVLNTMLAKPHITEAAGRALVARVAELRSVQVADLLEKIELRSNPYCFRVGNAAYLVRNGRFLKRKAKGEFQPISNFALRIDGTKSHHAGGTSLAVSLTIGVRQAFFDVTEAVFNNAARLWRATRSGAAAAGLDYPTMTSVPDRKLLPELVRGSHAWKAYRPKTCGFPIESMRV